MSITQTIQHVQNQINEQSMRDAWEMYYNLTCEYDELEEETPNIIDEVSKQLTALIADIDTNSDHLSAESNRTLSFVKSFIITQIKAQALSNISSFVQSDESKKTIDALKNHLSAIEKFIPKNELDSNARSAANDSRLENSLAAIEEKKDRYANKINKAQTLRPLYQAASAISSINPLNQPALHKITKPATNIYYNWLDGTLNKDQDKILKTMQWQTQSAPIKPVKAIVNAVDHFVEDRLKSPIQTALVSWALYDTAIFMTSIGETHPEDTLTIKNSSEKTDLITDDFMTELSNLGNITTTNNITESASRCMDRIDTDSNLVGMALNAVGEQYCVPLKDGITTAITISTTTPRTIQNSQKQLSEYTLDRGSLLETTYTRHHEEATEAIQQMAIADNSFHIVLLLIGAGHAANLLLKHQSKTINAVTHAAKKQLNSIKNRPLTLIGAFAGSASYMPLTGNEYDFIASLPFATAGALAGYATQRKRTHLTKNNDFISNLNPETANSNIPANPTSLDKKSSNLKEYIQNNPKKSGALGYLALNIALVASNNTGLLNESSPEIIKDIADYTMAINAWGGGILSWLTYDMLEDGIYHKTLPQLGMATTLAVGLPLAYGYDYGKTAINHSKERIKKQSKSVKKSIATGLLALKLSFSDAANHQPKTQDKPALLSAHTTDSYGTSTISQFEKQTNTELSPPQTEKQEPHLTVVRPVPSNQYVEWLHYDSRAHAPRQQVMLGLS